jgi:hypothetical protein
LFGTSPVIHLVAVLSLSLTKLRTGKLGQRLSGPPRPSSMPLRVSGGREACQSLCSGWRVPAQRPKDARPLGSRLGEERDGM